MPDSVNTLTDTCVEQYSQMGEQLVETSQHRLKVAYQVLNLSNQDHKETKRHLLLTSNHTMQPSVQTVTVKQFKAVHQDQEQAHSQLIKSITLLYDSACIQVANRVKD